MKSILIFAAGIHLLAVLVLQNVPGQEKAEDRTIAEAEAAFERAWNDSHHTRIELAPLDMNRVLKANYVMSQRRSMTAAELWDMELKKFRDPTTYIPTVVRSSATFGHQTLPDGAEMFVRLSEQRQWLNPSNTGRYWRGYSSTTADERPPLSEYVRLDGMTELSFASSRASHSSTSSMPWEAARRLR